MAGVAAPPNPCGLEASRLRTKQPWCRGPGWAVWEQLFFQRSVKINHHTIKAEPQTRPSGCWLRARRLGDHPLNNC